MLKVYKSPKKIKLVVQKRVKKSNVAHEEFIVRENKKVRQYIDKECGSQNPEKSSSLNKIAVCTTIHGKHRKNEGGREKCIVLKRTKRTEQKHKTKKNNIKFVIPSLKKQQKYFEKRKKILKEINKLNHHELSNVLASHRLVKSNTTASKHILQTIAKHAF